MAAPVPDSNRPSIPRRGEPRRRWSRLLLFAAVVLLINALVGDKGLTEAIRARKNYARAADDLARIQRENAALRDEIRQLRTDPAAIEAIARRDLGLMRRGEVMVTVREATPRRLRRP